MSVRSRIASYEAQNEDVRKASPSSPRSTPVVSPNSLSPAARYPCPPASPGSPPAIADSPERPPSGTSVASQSRISRLQLQQNGSRREVPHEPVRLGKTAQTRRLMGVPERAPTATTAGPNTSLFSHRKGGTDSSGQRPSLLQNKVANKMSGRRMIMQPKLDSDRPEQQTSATTQTGSLSRLGKIQRIKQMRQGERAKQRESPNVSQTHSLDATNDDEITLTSVRQIVDSSGKDMSANEDRDKDLWKGEEKSNKGMNMRMMARSSSSDYETDGEASRGATSALYGEQLMQGPSLSASQLTPDVSAFYDRRNRQQQSRNKEDDETFDYSARDDVDDDDDNGYAAQTFDTGHNIDDASHDSVSYSKRIEKKTKAKEDQARKKAAAAARAGMTSPFMQNETVEQCRKHLENPTVKTGLGVAAAATVGCVVMGPVGLLVGAAAVGIGVGVLQIPAEQRRVMKEKATEAFKGAQESAMNCSESISNSCAHTYQNSGITDHVPEEMKTCCTAIEEEVTGVKSSAADGDRIVETGDAEAYEARAEVHGAKLREARDRSSPTRFGKKDIVACLRQGKIVPVNQIHALDPSAQPRAWLDVLASAKTSHDEKMEATQEIMILSKDKQRARLFLEEGILDSIMWTLSRYLEKVDHASDSSQWAHPEVTPDEAFAAKLSAQCCLTLGKSHCAAIHTGGDLLLMSMYERGTVPEERQLAQMLHEVPYHARVTKTEDPTIVDVSKETFAMKQLSLPQAEELAYKIKAVAGGQL